jgi:hypothetical protein
MGLAEHGIEAVRERRQLEYLHACKSRHAERRWRLLREAMK